LAQASLIRGSSAWVASLEVSGFLNMADDKPEKPVKFNTWGTAEVAQFLDEHNLSAYKDNFIENDILGKHLPLLNKQELKDLGVKPLGDRLALTKEIQGLALREKLQKRKEKIAEAEEAWDGNWTNQFCFTCCGLFPWDPDRYILTPTNLRIKSYEFYRLCGIWKLVCCGGTWTSDNIPLNKIVDIDRIDYKVGMLCCKETKSRIELKGIAGTQADSETARLQGKVLLLEDEYGEEFQKKLKEAMEEYKLLVGLPGKVD